MKIQDEHDEGTKLCNIDCGTVVCYMGKLYLVGRKPIQALDEVHITSAPAYMDKLLVNLISGEIKLLNNAMRVKPLPNATLFIGFV